MKQIARFFLALFALAASPAFADNLKPIVIKNGQVQQLPSGSTLAVPITQTGTGAQAIDINTLLQQSLVVTEFIPAANSGVWGNGVVDDGPMLRNALAECSRLGFRAVRLPQPPVAYLVKTLDTSGLGALVFGDGTNAKTCAVIGEAVNTWGDYNGGVNIKLDSGLNRPLVYVRTGAASPVFANVRLDGNKAGQTGYTGDATCNSKLYTICVQDGATSPEGSVRMRDSWVVGGYNGNLYIGSGRGATNLYNTWFQYSGQGSSDYSIYLNGYDGEFFGAQNGPNSGNGWMVAEGSQYQWHGGATFMNTYDGFVINGDKVPYLYLAGQNIQWNGCNGIHEIGSSPFAGQQAGGHMIVSVTFDGNSNTTTNTCADVYSDNSTRLNLASPNFLGNVITANAKAKYNIQHNGTSIVRVTNPSFSATPNATAISNNYLSIYCAGCNRQNTWTPVLAGSTTAGTVTYVTQVGTWSRSNNEVTVHFALQWSAWSSPAGNVTITGLPYTSGAGTMVGNCFFNNVNGWTGNASATTLTAVVGSSSTTSFLYEYGRALNAAPVPVSELAGVGILQGTCIYYTDN